MNVSLMAKAALVAALTAATAVVAIPIGSVPVTLQVFFVLLAGLVLGPVYGALSMIVYMLLGIVGLPVFAGGAAGIGVVVGPSGGYLFGFILAAIVVGTIGMRGNNSISQLAIAMGAGIVAIYVLGVVQLSLVTGMSLVQAVLAGAAPFIIFDVIKAVAAVAVARRIGLANGRSTRR
ncbi:MAG: biotin transporter BioY [Candidatus Aquicultor sp.]|nr:biotin transporter BioY [Candidatus Aquicultor sp.]